MKLFKTIQLCMFSCVFVLSGCATVLGDKTVTVTQAQVQQKLTEKLATPLTFLKIFDVNLTNPIVRFDGTTERMSASLDANVKNALLGSPFAGKANISGKLKFDPKTNAVLLTETKIDQLNFEGLGGKYSELIALLSAKLGSELLSDVPLYTVKAQDLKVGNTNYVPKLMKVTNNGLEVTLSPKY